MKNARTLMERILRWVLWVFMNTVGYVIALLVFFIVVVSLGGGTFWSERIYSNGPLWFELMTRGSGIIFDGSMKIEVYVLCALTFAVTFSVTQWLVLMDQIPTWWTLASIAGYTVIITLIGSPFCVTRAGVLFTFNILTLESWTSLPALAVGAVAGAIIGTMQWLALRKPFLKAGWWIPANVIGWAASHAMVAAVLSSSLGSSDAAAIALAMLFLLALVAQGLVIGLPTGFVLIWLLGHRRPQRTPEWLT